GQKPPRTGRPGFGRTLHPNPDRVFDARLTACPKCQAAFPATLQTPQQIYERIELPPIKPDVTQVRLFGGRCACCGERVNAATPSNGKSAWRICCAMRHTPSNAATPPSAPRSSACCCVRSPSGDGVTS